MKLVNWALQRGSGFQGLGFRVQGLGFRAFRRLGRMKSARRARPSALPIQALYALTRPATPPPRTLSPKTLNPQPGNPDTLHPEP